MRDLSLNVLIYDTLRDALGPGFICNMRLKRCMGEVAEPSETFDQVSADAAIG
jgi:hypothetical protein